MFVVPLLSSSPSPESPDGRMEKVIVITIFLIFCRPQTPRLLASLLCPGKKLRQVFTIILLTLVITHLLKHFNHRQQKVTKKIN